MRSCRRARAPTTVSVGTAKPRPCAKGRMAVVMPTTRPRLSTSGPPELPGLIGVSVWIRPVSGGWPRRGRQRAVDGADDAGGDGPAQAVGVADRDDQLADAHRRRDQLGDRQRRGGGDAQDGDVDRGVAKLDQRRAAASVAQANDDRGRALHDVGVGDDAAGGVEDDAGAGALRHVGLRVVGGGRRLVGPAAARRPAWARYLDFDDGGAGPLGGAGDGRSSRRP